MIWKKLVANKSDFKDLLYSSNMVIFNVRVQNYVYPLLEKIS